MNRIGFINELCSAFDLTADNIFALGQKHGWLEYEDELFGNDEITRKHMARILHMFLLKEMGICDIPDIRKAECLRDLYDCRVCSGHVAQVYLRGIMDAKSLGADPGFLWFDLEGTCESSVIRETIRHTVETVRKYKTQRAV